MDQAPASILVTAQDNYTLSFFLKEELANYTATQVIFLDTSSLTYQKALVFKKSL